jgi:hypothetical protein
LNCSKKNYSVNRNIRNKKKIYKNFIKLLLKKNSKITI